MARWMGLAALLAWAAVAAAADPPGMFVPVAEGERLPPLVLADRDGVEHDISRSPDGGPVGIFFWSVFCPNCRELIPRVARLQAEWEGRGLTLWAVNVDGRRFSNAVDAYLAEETFSLRVVYDRLDGEYLVAADPLGVSKTPTLYLADAAGRVIFRQAVAIELDAAAAALAAAPRRARAR